MGVVDNMLPTESIKVFLVNDRQNSEENSLGLGMENGDSNGRGRCASRALTLKFKQRRVSAVRDFPPGCGISPSQNFASLGKESSCAGYVENSTCEEMNGSLGQMPTLSSPGMVMLQPSEVLNNSINNVDLIAPGEGLARGNYPPRRRASAVRDFPPFCGKDAPEIENSVAVKVLGSAHKRHLDQIGIGFEENPMKKAVKIDERQTEAYTKDDSCADKRKWRGGYDSDLDKVEAGSNDENTGIQFGNSCSNEMTVTQENLQENTVKSDNLNIKSQVVALSSCKDIGSFEGASWAQIATHVEEKAFETKLADCLDCANQLLSFEPLPNRVIVLGLMAKRICPSKQVKALSKPNNLASSGSCKENGSLLLNQPKHDLCSEQNEVKNFGGTYTMNEPSLSAISDDGMTLTVDNHDCCVEGESHQKQIIPVQPVPVLVRKNDETGNFEGVYEKRSLNFVMPNQGMGLTTIGDKDLDHECSGRHVDPWLNRNQSLCMSLPACTSILCRKDDENDIIVTRNKLRETLQMFQVFCRKLLQEEEAKSKESGNVRTRMSLYCQAARILKEKGKYINPGKKIIGPVPGVEVGDEFMLRVELNIVGLHRQIQGGIDFVRQGQVILATSIVASGAYDDDTDYSDVLIYTGSGGNMLNGDKEPEDQKLERGNLALKNSMVSKSPVRVIRGETKASDSSDGRGRTYVYDGLYLVEKFWQEMGPHGKLVFKFLLVRMPGQPELPWNVVKKSKKLKVRDGLCINDISLGKEIIPICAVNTIDDEKPPPFEYVARMIYPDWCQPIPQQGCGCTGRCTESQNCLCLAKNGGIPYNHDGAIVEVKPLVYECGPSCRCPPSCYNRVTQRGIKFQLEIFKTASMGWGVRSLNSIPSGSFICEYTGELLDEKEAEQRAYDEYLFDIGNHNNDNSLWDRLSNILLEQEPKSKELVGDRSFTIDAAKYGNVGRFINHSCSPNLYAQNVLYDHGDKKIPHIMFFAAENIRPLQELCYDYNYKIDHVFDSDGNIRKKNCYCGSSDCKGRMY